jgi:hypothetical protein
MKNDVTFGLFKEENKSGAIFDVK